MEGQTESVEVRLPVEQDRCSVESCGEPATAEFEARPFCLEHFLCVSRQELESRNDSLKGQPFDAAAIDSFRKFLTACAEQAKRLAEDGTIADRQIQSRLLDVLLRASDLSRRLRRSPRVAAFVPVWLRREDPGRTWEEETWTSTVSRHGAGLTCRHSVEAGATVVLCRKEKGGRVRARVVYSRFDSEGRRQIGVELLDQEDFWGLSQNSHPPESISPAA